LCGRRHRISPANRDTPRWRSITSIPGQTSTRSVPELRGGTFEAISVTIAAREHTDGLAVKLKAEDRQVVVDPAVDRGPSADAGSEGRQIVRVRLISVRDAQADARLLERWAELEREALEPNPFFAPQMVLPAVRHLEGGHAVQLLVAEQGGELRFLMPVSGGTARYCVPANGLRAWMHNYCFLGTPLLAACGDPDRVWAAVIDHLRRGCPASLLVVPCHTAQGPVAAALYGTGLGAGLGIRCGPAVPRGFVLRRPQPSYAGEWISRRHLADIARRRRQLGRMVGAELATVDRAAAGLDGAIEQFLTLEAKGWKGRGRTALACRPGDARFFREVSRGFADQGRLMFLSLEAGTRVLAQSAALVGGEGLFGFRRAYDEDFARWSPGSQLDLDVLDWFHQHVPLAWLDTCSDPDDGTDAFGDHRAICTLAIPLSPLGNAAAAVVPAAIGTRRRLRTTRAGALVRWHRRARKKG
jgi:CelD/BcsL family acetyltransferase involved in cellulose biosynthesis